MRYLSVTTRTRFHLPPIKGSRFIATVAPVTTESAALATVRAVAAELSDARHHCWAFRLHDRSRCRSSDDGEPGGSAGRPILAQIEGHGLFDVVVVVTRYFGGVKLGVGGLIRAYGGCAGKALDSAEIATITPTRPLRITTAYADTAAVDAVLGRAALSPRESRYEAEVHLTVDVPFDALEAIRCALRDATAGRVRMDDPEDRS